MAWTDLYGQSRQNLTSLIGTMSDLAMRMKELKQRKKDNWMQLLNTGLGIAGDIGGGFLQNKWNKEAAATKFGQEKELKGIDAQNEAIKATIAAARGKSAYEQQQGDAFAEARMEEEAALNPESPEYKLKMAQAGYYNRMPGAEGEGKSKNEIPKFESSLQLVDYLWGMQKSNVQRLTLAEKVTALDIDALRKLAITEGAKQGFEQPDIENAVNSIAEMYGLSVVPTKKDIPPPPPAISTPPPANLSEHLQAIKSGVTGAGKAIGAGAKEAFTQVINPGLTEQSVLAALQQAKATLSPKDYAKSGLGKYESEVSATGNLPPTRLKQMMDMIKAVTGK